MTRIGETEMRKMTLWIENNPETGSIKPWEVWYQVEGFGRKLNASAKTEAGALKSMVATKKRNSAYFEIAA